MAKKSAGPRPALCRNTNRRRHGVVISEISNSAIRIGVMRTVSDHAYSDAGLAFGIVFVQLGVSR
jgi:hypothetical protein